MACQRCRTDATAPIGQSRCGADGRQQALGTRAQVAQGCPDGWCCEPDGHAPCGPSLGDQRHAVRPLDEAARRRGSASRQRDLGRRRRPCRRCGRTARGTGFDGSGSLALIPVSLRSGRSSSGVGQAHPATLPGAECDNACPETRAWDCDTVVEAPFPVPVSASTPSTPGIGESAPNVDRSAVLLQQPQAREAERIPPAGSGDGNSCSGTNAQERDRPISVSCIAVAQHPRTPARCARDPSGIRAR